MLQNNHKKVKALNLANKIPDGLNSVCVLPVACISVAHPKVSRQSAPVCQSLLGTREGGGSSVLKVLKARVGKEHWHIKTKANQQADTYYVKNHIVFSIRCGSRFSSGRPRKF